ncbi:MAG: substrate-binding domain-containing protein [Acidimicrobiales bacterium]
MKFTSGRHLRRLAALVFALSMVAAACGSDAASDTATTNGSSESTGSDVGVTLVLKNTSNPFFVNMAEQAQAEADSIGVKPVAAGKEDGDTQTQIDAIEAAVARGDKGILITPTAMPLCGPRSRTEGPGRPSR